MKKTMTSSFVLAFALAAAGCDTAQEKAAKPGIIDDIVRTSVELCERGAVGADEYAYASRLRAVLEDVSGHALKIVNEKGVTVCLDQRLPGQVDGFFDRRIHAIYYPQPAPVMSIWDTGTLGGWTSLSEDARSYGDTAIEKLASAIEDGEASTHAPMYVGRYSCGKSCTTTRLKAAEDFDQDSIRNNPQLQNAPLRKAPKPQAGVSV
jgi:hypothetical protein